MNALVVGCLGQDGSYLTEHLKARGVAVYGLGRQGLHLPDGTLEPDVSIGNILLELRPERIFHLAAYHHSAEEMMRDDGEIMRRSVEVHVLGLLAFLEAMHIHSLESRLFYAASSHVFGTPRQTPQDENTPMDALCPYGITKAAGVQLCRMYRHRHRLYCSVGFLYNHESPRRRSHFLSRKIVQAAVAIHRGEKRQLVLGNLEAQVDWGYAPEYVDAMVRILELDRPDDFIIASGSLHRVRDFVAEVFDQVGLDWRDHVSVDPSVLKKQELPGTKVGDYSRLHRETGWAPTTNLARLAAILVQAELEQDI
ncbi:MAG: GDP-mannose 4,6-dehydratase [Magnetococcales bacterium]|nr:GDP-mannose 4,6-dehydratase [Magnetococcales bacterium]